jgi:hypothetical protein
MTKNFLDIGQRGPFLGQGGGGMVAEVVIIDFGDVLLSCDPKGQR